MHFLERMLWYVGNIWDYGLQMLPCAIFTVALLLCLRPWRKKRLAALGMVSSRRREGVLLLFAAFTAGLAALTLTPPNFWGYLYRGIPITLPAMGTNQFYWHITLLEQLTAGAWIFFMLLGNLGMFMPLAFFPALLWQGVNWKVALCIGFGSSLLVETVQLFIGRSSDINDLIVNTLGALCGYWLALLLRRLAPQFTAQLKCNAREDP